MSVTEKESGITAGHIKALETTMRNENTFLFVRPTEFDSTVLIKEGYATKSMDVHHKSSNWGPMAGFVPCDPAFSKKCEGQPNPHEHEHKHGKAYPVQLGLKPSLLASHTKIEFKTGFILKANTGSDKSESPYVVLRKAAEGSVAARRQQFESFQSGGSVPEHKFCTASPAEIGNKSTLFCLLEKGGEWLVYWVKMEGETGTLNPLRVFAYVQNGRLNPVTGDYDLWMVAPHISHLDKHIVVQLNKDEHGSSAASGYTVGLIHDLNRACSRADNPVFQHGAESQNYGFTQALDWNLAMFTAAGTSRMVRISQMPGILSDLRQAGYLVVWNKRYGEIDPQLMGKADSRGVMTLKEIRGELDSLYEQLAEIRSSAKPLAIAQQAASTRQMPAIMQKELAMMAKRFEASRNLGLEQSRIYRFNRELLAFLESQREMFRVLKNDDFGASFRKYNAEVRQLHTDLQSMLVRATTGGGQTDETLLKTWVIEHRRNIDSIKNFWT